MATMICIGIFVAITRFCMQYKEIQQLMRLERLRVAAVYMIGMMATFIAGSYLIDWTKEIAVNSLLQTLLFIVLFATLFFVVHQIMRIFLPKRYVEQL